MTAIKIQTQEDYIPVHLGNEEFRFYYTDDSIIEIRSKYKDVQKEYEAIRKEVEKEGASDEHQIEKMKEILDSGFEFLFGEGTFDKVYAISPSVITCLNYFGQMVDGVLAELDKKLKVTPQDKAKKYINSKNKKK